MTNEQMELGFNGIQLRPGAKQTRVARANWWFAQMREVVGRAMDWTAETNPRPEQIWMPGANREVKV
jgi:hypothetical protein